MFWTASKTIRYWLFSFLTQLLIRMKFYIKSHVRLYKILCSLVFFLTSISFIRYKVTVKVLICFVFPSWITFSWMSFWRKYRPNLGYSSLQSGNRTLVNILIIGQRTFRYIYDKFYGWFLFTFKRKKELLSNIIAYLQQVV